jgi:hypothetical protein
MKLRASPGVFMGAPREVKFLSEDPAFLAVGDRAQTTSITGIDQSQLLKQMELRRAALARSTGSMRFRY